ncbi:proteasome assembly chaperone family protein [Candidatus Micrarchaeota archaeon]|nr:proteasome assembly chaperone family protein [Candidatus Micrarchaeota archaeon]
MEPVELRRTADMKDLKKPTVVLGFPGTGLVGSVAASHLIDVLQLKFGGYITSSDFAPLAAIHDYTPMPAARLHYSEKYNIVVIISEMTIPVGSSKDLAEKILVFANSVKATSVVSLGGISLKEGGKEVYVVSSDLPIIKDVMKRKIAKPIKEGATTGVTGVLLAKGTLAKYPVTAFLAEASEEYLDPGAAVNVLKVLSRFLNIPIDTAGLEKEAKELSKGLKESIIKSRISKKGGTAAEGGSMYG